MFNSVFSYILFYLYPLVGLSMNSRNDQLPADLIAQLVEHLTSIAEVMV